MNSTESTEAVYRVTIESPQTGNEYTRNLCAACAKRYNNSPLVTLDKFKTTKGTEVKLPCHWCKVEAKAGKTEQAREDYENWLELFSQKMTSKIEAAGGFDPIQLIITE